jgi:hypothetical protein
MDLFHKIMALVDKNSDRIPEGDYLELCDTIQELREHVKPPSFLDQTLPTWISDYDPVRDGPPVYQPTVPMTDGQPRDWMDDELPSDPDTVAQREREQIRHRWRELDEEVMYPGLNQFLQDLHEEWSDPVEPGFYYPPPRQAMHGGTTVVEVTLTSGPDT